MNVNDMYRCAEADQPSKGAEDNVINIEQGNKKSGEGEEEGKMQEGGQRFNSNYPGKVKLVEALGKKSANRISLM